MGIYCHTGGSNQRRHLSRRYSSDSVQTTEDRARRWGRLDPPLRDEGWGQQARCGPEAQGEEESKTKAGSALRGPGK